MGIWSPLPADNDDASDWLIEFEELPSIVALNDAFDAILNVGDGEYLEITECAQAVVAASIVDESLLPSPTHSVLSEELRNQVRGLMAKLDRSASLNLVKRALSALRIVGSDEERSELFQLWQDSESENELWHENIEAMIERLDAAVKRMESR